QRIACYKFFEKIAQFILRQVSRSQEGKCICPNWKEIDAPRTMNCCSGCGPLTNCCEEPGIWHPAHNPERSLSCIPIEKQAGRLPILVPIMLYQDEMKRLNSCGGQ